MTSVFHKTLRILFQGLFFIGIILFLAGIGYRGKHSNTADSFLPTAAIGLVILLPFIIFFIRSLSKEKQKQEALQTSKIVEHQLFLKEAQIIILDLNTTEIITFNGKNPDFYDSIVGEQVQKKNHNTDGYNEVVLKFPLADEIREYQFQTKKGLDSIKIHFALKKSTIVYFETLNTKNIYIDIRFLKD